MTMYPISGLLKSLPAVSSPRMILSGFGVWIVWGARNNSTIHQTLLRFGGLKIIEQPQQSLWFFHDAQVFPALARLQIWAQIHPEPVIIQVLPSKIMLGESVRDLSISLYSPLDEQKLEPSSAFEIWIHPELSKQVGTFPGLSVQQSPHPFGMAPAAWHLFRADPSFSLDAELSWYFFVKPMKDPDNESFNQRWKQQYLNLKTILDRLGIRYIYQEGLVFFKIDGLSMLNTWCRELITTISHAKSEDKRSYWPCLLRGIPQQGLAFNEELPKKASLGWNRLAPDMPHIPLSAALLLRNDFDIVFLDTSGPLSLDSPCQLSLASSADSTRQALVFPASLALSSGSEATCYYCGLKNHAPRECPSRQLFNCDPGIWDKLSRLDFKDMVQAVKTLDKRMEGTSLATVQDLLQAEGPENIIAKAVFEISAPVQHRTLRLVWRSKGKDLPEGLRQLSPPEGDFIWAALENLRTGNAAHAERMMQQAALRAPKNYQPRVLLGFIALEDGNMRKTETHWNEAHSLCFTPLQNAYLFFLKGRLKEIQEAFDQAHGLYRDAQGASPKWLEPRYRQAVCMVKKGFLDQAWSIFSELLAEDPHVFNRLLLDVELRRGRPSLLASLANPWSATRQAGRKAQEEMEKLSAVLNLWFEPSDAFHQNTMERLNHTKDTMQAENFVAFSKTIQLVARLQKETEKKIQETIATMKIAVHTNIERLRLIQNEITGFPFPRIIYRITGDTNKCARLLQSIIKTDLHAGEKFKLARKELLEAETILQRLIGRLRSIKILRDGTLFFLFLGRNFLWLALIGLIASAVIVPVVLHSLQKADLPWASEWVSSQRWQVQRAVSTITLIICAAIATVWTSLRFEKQKNRYLEGVQRKKRKK
jgi:tetratricopeptide (TPR) repeat protein